MATQRDEINELQVELEPLVQFGRIPRFISWYSYRCRACGEILAILIPYWG
jgi:hypothetical protein